MSTYSVSVSHNLSSCCNASDLEDRIAGLKILAAYLPAPSQRMQCFSEILRLRSAQLANEARSPFPVAGR